MQEGAAKPALFLLSLRLKQRGFCRKQCRAKSFTCEFYRVGFAASGYYVKRNLVEKKRGERPKNSPRFFTQVMPREERDYACKTVFARAREGDRFRLSICLSKSVWGVRWHLKAFKRVFRGGFSARGFRARVRGG